MMPDLFPAFPMPSPIADSDQAEVQYPSSPLFDFETGNYVTDGAGRYVIADGLTAWVQWCKKAAMTERFGYLAYSTDYGGELEEARRQPTRAAAQLEMERTITETLMVDPRTQAVRDFDFHFEGDSVWVSFTAVPVIGQEQRVEVKI